MYGMKMPEDMFGRGRDWNVDLIPKFLMANGKLNIDICKLPILHFKNVHKNFFIFQSLTQLYSVRRNLFSRIH